MILITSFQCAEHSNPENSVAQMNFVLKLIYTKQVENIWCNYAIIMNGI